MNALGARVRLVKGAYREPRRVAYQTKAQVDAAFIEIMRLLLTEGVYPAIATHDPAMIDATAAFAAATRHRRRPLRVPDALRRPARPAGAAGARQGYRVRVYVPFGREWFPYFMRRLGERPANVGFVVRSLLRER